jgi:hypothetical protein
MTSSIAPTLDRHRLASGSFTRSRRVVIAEVPVSRIGDSTMRSHRLASSASAEPNRKDWDRASWVPSKKGGHHVPGAAPAVDRLGRVADHHQLAVGALGAEDLFNNWVGVLGLVEQQEVRFDPGLGQGPDLQVVVVVEADDAFLRVLDVFPCPMGVRQYSVDELGVQVFGFDAAQARDVVALDGAVSGLAEAGDGPQHGVRERLVGDIPLADADTHVDGNTQRGTGLPTGHPGRVHPGPVPVTHGAEGERVRGLAPHVAWELVGRVVRDRLVERDVPAGFGRAGREHRQRRRLPGSGAGLQDQVVPAPEGIDGRALLRSRCGHCAPQRVSAAS